VRALGKGRAASEVAFVLHLLDTINLSPL